MPVSCPSLFHVIVDLINKLNCLLHGCKAMKFVDCSAFLAAESDLAWRLTDYVSSSSPFVVDGRSSDLKQAIFLLAQMYKGVKVVGRYADYLVSLQTKGYRASGCSYHAHTGVLPASSATPVQCCVAGLLLIRDRLVPVLANSFACRT